MSATVEKDIGSILAMPLVGIQSLLSEKLLYKSFSADDRDKALEALEKVVPADLQKAFEREKIKIAEALDTGVAPAPPDFSSPELQLLWAAHLVHLAVNSSEPIEQTPLWKQLTECDDAKQELRKHAFYIARDAINPSTRLKWGDPGSMFYSDPVNNQINIDFLMSLIGGFEDTRSIIFHEIGHSKLTRGYPKKMTETRDALEALVQKANSGEISQDEYAQMQGLNAEWQFRNAIFQEGENSPVNRYSINVGNKVGQDLDHSLNVVETTIAQAATHSLPTQDTPAARFENLARAVRMSLYKNNGLFPDDQKGWERVGVRPEWIQALPKSKKGKMLPPKESFEELMALCGSNDGLEHLQPNTVDRMRGADWLENATTDYAAKRNAIMEDEIWDRFAEPLVRPLIEQVKQQAREQMKQPKQQPQQQDKGQQGKSQGQNQSGQKQGQPQNGQQGQGDQGQQSGQGGESKGQSVKVKGVGDMPSVDVPPQTPQEVKKKDSKGDGEPEEKGKSSDSKAESDKTSDAGDDDAAKKSPVTPSKKQQEELADKSTQAGQDGSQDKKTSEDTKGEKTPTSGSSSEGEKKNGQTIEALLREIDDAKRGKLESPKQEETEPTPAKSDESSSSGRGAGSSSVKSAPRIGDWKDYQACVAQFGAEIRQARNLLVQIQEKQAKITHNPTHMRSILPDDGDMTRFDEASHESLVTKLLTGQNIGEQDARRFVIDEETKAPASIDVVISIDGSGSMYQNHSSNYTSWSHSPIQAGINIASILNEAAKKPRNHRSKDAEGDIRIWGMVWGNNPPSMIMQPGDDPIKVGKAIAGLKESRGWGTDLAPAVKHTTKALAEHKGNPNTPVGFTHQIVVSDGDIADPAAAAISVDRMLENNRQTTFDVVVIQEGQTEMDKVVKAMQKKHGEARVKLVHCDNPEQAHASILTLLRERMLATGHSRAVPFQEKQKDFKKAYEAMR